MMGPAHLSSGLAVGALTLPLAPVHDIASQVGWIAVMGGAAVLPDLDGRGTASRVWGPITGILATAVGFVARGHRALTHDLVIGVAAAWIIMYASAHNQWTSIAAVALSVGLALEAVGRFLPGDWKSPGMNFIASVAVTYGVVSNGYDWSWLPWCVAVGVITHILGDALTTAGIPVPFTSLTRKRSFGLRLFDAGHPVEKPITWVCLALSVAGAVFWIGVNPIISLV